MEKIGECPKCKMPVHVNFDEPGEWCSSDNIPDGYYDEKCSYCSYEYTIVIDWTPKLYVEEKE